MANKLLHLSLILLSTALIEGKSKDCMMKLENLEKMLAMAKVAVEDNWNECFIQCFTSVRDFEICLKDYNIPGTDLGMGFRYQVYFTLKVSQPP